MLSRLQIILLQLKAGNNSEKLKNEIKTTIVLFVSCEQNDKNNL